VNKTAYFILYIDGHGQVFDSQVASEFPVTHVGGNYAQALVAQAEGSDYGEACDNVLEDVKRMAPWLLDLDKTKKQRLLDKHPAVYGDLDEGPFIPGGGGMAARRLVLRYVGGFQPFVTHLRLYHHDGGISHVSGHYFKDEEDARKDLAERVERGF
jgi:hypothetical protein